MKTEHDTLSPTAQGLLHRSLESWRVHGLKQRTSCVTHLRSKLSEHENAEDVIGIGYGQDFVDAAKSFLSVLISEEIQVMVKEFEEAPYDINNGRCDEFANTLANRMEAYGETVTVLSSDMIFNYRDVEFARENWVGDILETRYGIWSSRLMDLYGSPKGVDLKDISDLPSHEWVCFNGRHYDAEIPEGYDNWSDLPIFRRLFDHYRN